MVTSRRTIRYIDKDITTVTKGIIAHGCNCQGVMNSGVAKSIRKQWPVVYQRFKDKGKGSHLLGTCDLIPVTDTDTLFVANCYTQVYYGHTGRFADCDAIESSLTQAAQFANNYYLHLYIPRIGAGRGGLDWTTVVKPIIDKIGQLLNTTHIYVCLWKEEEDDDTSIFK